jgi:hypothetical protein
MVITYHATASPASEWFYFIIVQDPLGPYPNLNATANTIENLQMMPVAIIRQDSVNADIDTNAAWYISTKALLRKIGLNIDDILDSINENPDIASVTDAFIHFGINPADDVPVISKMLYWSFYEMTARNVISSNTKNFSARFTEQNVNRASVWSAQTYTEISGSIGVVNTYEHVVTGTNLTVRRQITVGEYAEIVILNVNATDLISKGTWHDMASLTIEDPNFNIPVSAYVIRLLSPIEQLQAFPYLLRFNFYALTVTEIEWYKTEEFNTLIQVGLQAASIYSIITTGFNPTDIFKQLIKNYLIQEGIKALARITGNNELAALAGIAAYIYIAKTYDSKSFAEMPDAVKVLEGVTLFSDNLTLLYNEDLKEIAKRHEIASKDFEKRMKEIEKAIHDPLIDSSFIASLQSVDTLIYQAVNSQYNFDQIYNYDTLVGDYHTNRLRLGVE